MSDKNSTDQSAAKSPPVVEILYSPACPQNARFIAEVRGWLEPFVTTGQIHITEVRTDLDPGRAAELLGVSDLSELTSNVFIAVYIDGTEVSKVPLHPDQVRNGVRTALDLPHQPATAPWAWWGEWAAPAKDLAHLELTYVPISRETVDRSLELCLCHHPSGGRTPDRFHAGGCELKRQLLEPALARSEVLGILALDGDHPAGLIEAYPRELARACGFVTGTDHDSGGVLTVTCIEVAGGYPRVELIDGMMRELLAVLTARPDGYSWIEGNGVYGWADGTNPYGVFEKHGFSRVPEIVPGRRVLMERALV